MNIDPMKDDETLAALVAKRIRELELELAERRKSEEALRASEVRYRRLFEGAKDGILILDAETGMVLDVNPFLVKLLGLSHEAFLGKQLWELGSFKDIAANRDKFLELQRKGYVRYEDLPLETAHGRRVRVEFVSNVYLADKQKVIQCNIRDITERKRAERALRQGAQRHRLILQTAMDGFWLADTQGRLLEVNQTYCRMSGYSEKELLTMHISELEAIESNDEVAARIHRIKSKGQDRFETRQRRKDGSIFDVEISVQYRPNEGEHLVMFLRNITERKQMEQQLRQAQKLEAIGELAGGVAHDFNNVLALIMMHLGLLQQHPNLDAETHESLKELVSESQRAAGLTRQLLMFSRRSILEVKVLDLSELVANLLKLLRRLIGEHINMRFDPTESLPAVEADAGMIEQVLMNLAINARDAMPKGGSITISTVPIQIETERVQGIFKLLPGLFVCLSVADTGCGMNEATLKRIFEPFFTTKEPGKGTGLGLATVYGIVAQHKGWVEAASEPGNGSIFKVFLPATTKRMADPTPTGKTAVKRGHETILLVEDEAILRRAVAKNLRKLGYQVLEANNGQTAMRLWEEQDGQIDLLLSDLVMPEGVTGLDLAEKLKAEKPNLKIILSSGYNAELAGQAKSTADGIVYLQKPYRIEVLSKVIRDRLEGA